MNNRLLVWVTSQCNLDCPLCSHKYTRKVHPGYQMGLAEARYVVNSIKKRKIPIHTIELTGGEPSLWINLEQGVSLFSSITDNVTLVTNGNNPLRIKDLNLKHWIVSASQATKKQMGLYKGCPVTYNHHQHKPLPQEPIQNSIPADCCVKKDCFGESQNSLLYLRGVVYYCCNAPALLERIPSTPQLVCNFEEDFISKFKDKDFEQEICSYCVCNSKVWKQI